MAKAASFGDVYAARDIAVSAADQSGDVTPVLSFLARYGKYLPMSQLMQLSASYLDVLPTASEERTSYLERSLDIGLSVDTGEGDRTVDTLVGMRGPDGTITKFRTIRSDLSASEGFAELQSQINAVLDAWKEQSGPSDFTVLAPVWRVE